MSTTPTLQDAAQALKPCPWCGGGETMLHVNKGTWNGRSYGEPVSIEVRHWCEPEDGQPARMVARVGRDEASAIAAWNRRAALTQGAGGSISSHIKQPYTLAEIRAKIASHDYSAELLLQHAMLLLEGAGAVEPVAFRMRYQRSPGMMQDYPWSYLEPEQRSKKPSPSHEYQDLYAAPPAQQLQQAVAREREECAVICERAVDSIWKYHEDNHKRTGRNVCTNLAAAIRAKGTHD